MVGVFLLELRKLEGFYVFLKQKYVENEWVEEKTLDSLLTRRMA